MDETLAYILLVTSPVDVSIKMSSIFKVHTPLFTTVSHLHCGVNVLCAVDFRRSFLTKTIFE